MDIITAIIVHWNDARTLRKTSENLLHVVRVATQSISYEYSHLTYRGDYTHVPLWYIHVTPQYEGSKVTGVPTTA